MSPNLTLLLDAIWYGEQDALPMLADCLEEERDPRAEEVRFWLVGKKWRVGNENWHTWLPDTIRWIVLGTFPEYICPVPLLGLVRTIRAVSPGILEGIANEQVRAGDLVGVGKNGGIQLFDGDSGSHYMQVLGVVAAGSLAGCKVTVLTSGGHTIPFDTTWMPRYLLQSSI